METLKKVKSFVRQFEAVVKGDDAAALGEKVFRQADSALQCQIASLKGDTIRLEDGVESAKEELALCRVNHGKTISNRDTYVSRLLEAKNGLTNAEEALEAHILKLEFLEEELKNLSTED